MKPTILLLLTLLLTTMLTAKQKLAISDFKPKGVTQNEAEIVSDMFRVALTSLGKYDIIDRKNIQQILHEQQLQLSGLTDEKNAVKIGKILNIQYIINGSLMKIKEKAYISATIINIETAKIEKSAKVEIENINKIGNAINLLVEKLTGLKSNKDFSSYVRKGFGILSIRTLPKKSDIYIDGKYVGQTDIFKEIKKGQHIIEIKHKGYLSKKIIEEISNGKTKEVNLLLVKGIGLEEAKKMKDIYFKNFIKDSIFVGSSLIGIGISIYLGKYYDNIGIEKYDEYGNANISSDAITLHNEYQSIFDNADAWFYMAETGIGFATLFSTLAVINFLKYKKFNAIFKKGNISSVAILPKFSKKKLGFMLLTKF